MKDNFSSLLYNLLPVLYRREDTIANPYPEPLKRFLKILSEGGYEDIISNIDSLYNASDIDNADPKYLHLLVNNLGLDFPYNMSEKDRRKFLKIIPTLYKYKGTADSYNYLAREIFSTSSKISTEAQTYVEGMPVEEWRKIFLNIEVDGGLPDIRRKEENFRKFVEVIRPVNRILIINLKLLYYTNYLFQEKVRDSWYENLYDNNGFELFTKTMTDPVLKEMLSLSAESDSYNVARAKDFLEQFYLNHTNLGKQTHGLGYSGNKDIIYDFTFNELVDKSKYLSDLKSSKISELNHSEIVTRKTTESSFKSTLETTKISSLNSNRLVTNFFTTHYTPSVSVFTY